MWPESEGIFTNDLLLTVRCGMGTVHLEHPCLQNANPPLTGHDLESVRHSRPPLSFFLSFLFSFSIPNKANLHQLQQPRNLVPRDTRSYHNSGFPPPLTDGEERRAVELHMARGNGRKKRRRRKKKKDVSSYGWITETHSPETRHGEERPQGGAGMNRGHTGPGQTTVHV